MRTEGSERQQKSETRIIIRAGKIYGLLALVLIIGTMIFRLMNPAISEALKNAVMITVVALCFGVMWRLSRLFKDLRQNDGPDEHLNNAFIGDLAILLLILFLTIFSAGKLPDGNFSDHLYYLIFMLVLPVFTGWGPGFAFRKTRDPYNDEGIAALRLRVCRIGYLLATVLFIGLTVLYACAPAFLWMGLCWALFINAAAPMLLFHILEGRDA